MTRRSWQFWASFFGIYAVCPKAGDMLIGDPLLIGHPLGGYIGVLVGSLVHWQISLHLARPYLRTLFYEQRLSGVF